MRRLLLPIPITLAAALSACQPPAVARAPAGAAGQPRSARLPEPGVYVLKQAGGSPVPAELKRPGYDPRRGGYFERVLGGRLYLMPNGDYYTVICADVVDSAGRGANPGDGGLGGEGYKYWVSGGRVYFTNVIIDGPVDSIAVRVHGDTVEFVRQVFVRDRTRVLPPYPLSEYVTFCPAFRASSAHGRPPNSR